MFDDITATIDSSIFRTYDIRGIVGKTLTEEAVWLIGRALGSLLCERGEHEIALGRDGRLSSPALMEVLSSSLEASGCQVMDIGMVPTPLLYYAVQAFEMHSGVMLTGSHNPAEYNGMKMIIQKAMLSENDIKGLYQRILAKRFSHGKEKNGMRKQCHITERYIADVTQNIRLARPLTIVIDAGNGVAGSLAPALFKSLGCTVYELFCDVDGRFPNHHPDPSEEKNLQHLIQMVKEKNADVGLAFDGDGDRLGVVTNRGISISPDRLLMLFARALLTAYPKAKIIFDVKCTNHLGHLIQTLGGDPIMWKTGHSLIRAKMAETGAKLAGEVSGHIFFSDRWYGFDDALYAGARLLEILAREEQSCDELFSNIPSSVITPELKVSVADEEKFQLMQQLIDRANFVEASDINTIDGLRVSFANGWGLIRPSNTTPNLILRFEAMNEKVLNSIQGLFRDWLLSVRPDLVLPF